MYVVDLRHCLDERGTIAPPRGPARRFADIVTAVVAHASDFDRPGTPGPNCLECRRHAVETTIDDTDTVRRHCPGCATEGCVSHWQDRFRDLSSGLPADGPAPP